MLYQKDAPGDWGQMQGTETCEVRTEKVSMADGTPLFMRSWVTDSESVLLILHGLGAHSGWFIDMGNQLSARGLTVYANDHRGFGRSGGLPGHIEQYQTYVDDLVAIITEIRKRHPGASLYTLGHSMGGIFNTHLAARHGDLLSGVLFLNPWVEDTARISPFTLIQVLVGGLFKSKRLWRLAGGTDVMTTNPEAIEMLNADPYWRRVETASFVVQILRMRLAVPKLATSIMLPALEMQAEADKSVLISGSSKLFDALASGDKTWKTYPGYAHDSEFEADRSQLDNDITSWILDQHGK
jgi:alpha-beta hydrolase superfamily lysophospholipase